MPLRDYKCMKCGFLLEDIFFKRENDVQLPDACPECGSRDGYRLKPSRASLVFKGDGFYENDYKKKK